MKYLFIIAILLLLVASFCYIQRQPAHQARKISTVFFKENAAPEERDSLLDQPTMTSNPDLMADFLDKLTYLHLTDSLKFIFDDVHYLTLCKKFGADSITIRINSFRDWDVDLYKKKIYSNRAQNQNDAFELADDVNRCMHDRNRTIHMQIHDGTEVSSSLIVNSWPKLSDLKDHPNWKCLVDTAGP